MDSLLERDRDAKALVGEVLASLAPDERKGVPVERTALLLFVIDRAVDRVREFGETLAKTVADLHANNPHGNRYVIPSSRDSLIFLYTDGHLERVKNPCLFWVDDQNFKKPATLELISYDSYEVLTGPRQSQTIDHSHSAKLPLAPEFKAGVISDWIQKTALGELRPPQS